MKNYYRFLFTLREQYIILFASDPDYTFVSQKYTPNALAQNVMDAIMAKDAHLSGKGIQRTCDILRISKNKRTANRLVAFLTGDE